MTNTQPKVTPDGRYELKDAAEALLIDRSTLLRYTHTGKIRCGIRKSNGHRVWCR